MLNAECSSAARIQARHDVFAEKLDRPERFVQRNVSECELPDQVIRARFVHPRFEKPSHRAGTSRDSLTRCHYPVEVRWSLVRRRTSLKTLSIGLVVRIVFWKSSGIAGNSSIS